MFHAVLLLSSEAFASPESPDHVFQRMREAALQDMDYRRALTIADSLLARFDISAELVRETLVVKAQCYARRRGPDDDIQALETFSDLLDFSPLFTGDDGGLSPFETTLLETARRRPRAALAAQPTDPRVTAQSLETVPSEFPIGVVNKGTASATWRLVALSDRIAIPYSTGSLGPGESVTVPIRIVADRLPKDERVIQCPLELVRDDRRSEPIRVDFAIVIGRVPGKPFWKSWVFRGVSGAILAFAAYEIIDAGDPDGASDVDSPLPDFPGPP